MRDIRRRIKTVRNIQQITKAMQMVAAARLQKAQSRATASRSYADQMLSVIGHLSSVAGEVNHPLLEVREPKKIGIIVITSDRGMAGSYNTAICRKMLHSISEYDKSQIKMITVGKKGRTFFTNQGYEIVAAYPMPSSDIDFADAKRISRTATDLFIEAEVDVVRVAYTRFISAIRNEITDTQLLPAAAPEGGETGTEGYIFEPTPEVLLGDLLPRYVDTQIYRAMLESLASEHGARMTAMKSATDNAVEMIDRLTLDLNRARQAAITRELAEIVGGADALK
jgi:F-type H+-transporting ATPase subunit gamma